jgi:Cd2+/Zn2+-exporting ATPase
MAQVKAIALDKTRTITYGTQSFLMFSAKRNQLPKLLACTAGTELFLNIRWRKPLSASRAEGFEPQSRRF